MTLTSVRPIRGFIVQARPINESALRFGSFESGVGYQTMECDEGRNSSVTHQDRSNKNLVEITWNPPSGDVGEVVFV